MIDEKEFIEYEAEIILSGCVKEFLIPKIYGEPGKIYWVYPDMEPSALTDYTNEDILSIQKLSKSYMLNPKNIVFHPDYIFRDEGRWKYHYLPTKRKLFYEDIDLKRYLALERDRFLVPTEVGTKKNILKKSLRKKQMTHILYNRNTGEIERLLLKQTYIGGRKCKLDVDFSGELKISSEGSAMLLSGEAYLNFQMMELKKIYPLNSGDNILCDQTEFLYW